MSLPEVIVETTAKMNDIKGSKGTLDLNSRSKIIKIGEGIFIFSFSIDSWQRFGFLCVRYETLPSGAVKH